MLFTASMFVLIEVMLPGDYATPSRLAMSQQQVEALRTQLGLDRPLPVRYLFWLRNVVTHGLGNTTAGTIGPNRGVPLADALPATALVFLIGLGLAYLIGTWLGRTAGWRRGAASRGITFLGVVSYTMFPPFVGFILTIGAGDWWWQLRNRLLHGPVPWVEVGRTAIMGQMAVTLLVGGLAVAVIGWLVRTLWRVRTPTVLALAFVGGGSLVWWWHQGILPYAIDVLFGAAIPILAFAWLSYGDFLLVTRTAMAGVVHDDYVMTAVAKGLPDRMVRDRHAGRNAILPVLGRLVVSIPYLLTGLVIIESAVGWNGVGTLLFDAVYTQDLPVVMDTLLVIGLFTLGLRLVFEAVQAMLDPRIWRRV